MGVAGWCRAQTAIDGSRDSHGAGPGAFRGINGQSRLDTECTLVHDRT